MILNYSNYKCFVYAGLSARSRSNAIAVHFMWSRFAVAHVGSRFGCFIAISCHSQVFLIIGSSHVPHANLGFELFLESIEDILALHKAIVKECKQAASFTKISYKTILAGDLNTIIHDDTTESERKNFLINLLDQLGIEHPHKNLVTLLVEQAHVAHMHADDE